MKTIIVDGIDSGYAITGNGNVFSYKTNKILKLTTKPTGYKQIGLWIRGKILTKRINRLVAEAFIPNPNNLPCVLHKDNNPANNKVCNLRWGTHQDNMNDKVRSNRQSRMLGVDHPMAKLTEEQVLQIRYLYSKGDTSQAKLAIKYNVDSRLIWGIVNRVIWKHI